MPRFLSKMNFNYHASFRMPQISSKMVYLHRAHRTGLPKRQVIRRSDVIDLVQSTSLFRLHIWFRRKKKRKTGAIYSHFDRNTPLTIEKTQKYFVLVECWKVYLKVWKKCHIIKLISFVTVLFLVHEENIFRRHDITTLAQLNFTSALKSAICEVLIPVI